MDGTLKPGCKLPPVRTIASQWGTTGRTVCSAIQALEKDGLLDSYDRLGTYVRKEVPPLKNVGIYYRDEAVLSRDVVYPQFFYWVLKEELLRQGLRAHLWIDPRTQEEEQEPWPRLVEACRRREIQGVLVPPGGTTRLQLPWLLKLPVPVAAVTGERHAVGVSYDSTDFMRRSVQALARQGCRSVGMMMSENLSPAPGRKAAWINFLPDLFCAAVAETGLKTRDEWICGDTGPAVDPRPIRTVPDIERFAREKFLELWSRCERPDGIVVTADDMAKGAFQGIQEAGVRVPEDLKVVCLRNLEVPRPSPFPVTWMVTSMREMSCALIEQIQRQHRHQKTEQVFIGFREKTEADREAAATARTKVDARMDAVLA